MYMEFKAAIQLEIELLLHDAKASNIETLKHMSAMRWIAEVGAVMLPCCIKETICIIQAVTINEECSLLAICLDSHSRIKMIAEPVSCNITIDPVIVRLKGSIMCHLHTNLKRKLWNDSAFAMLLFHHELVNHWLLKIIKSWSIELSAQIVIRTVTFSWFAEPCLYWSLIPHWPINYVLCVRCFWRKATLVECIGVLWFKFFINIMLSSILNIRKIWAPNYSWNCLDVSEQDQNKVTVRATGEVRISIWT